MATIEITEEFATTMGFGGWPSSFDIVSIAFDRYLIASGFWTIDSRRWVMVYDLATDQIRFFNRDVPEAATVTEFAVTEEGRTLVQVNSNGHLYFYDVGSEKLVLRGVDIDDELVVYDPRGYYAASPEGAQFVFLKFPAFPVTTPSTSSHEPCIDLISFRRCSPASSTPPIHCSRRLRALNVDMQGRAQVALPISNWQLLRASDSRR